MNRIKKAGCVLLALLWMLPLFSAAAEGSPAAEDPIIVRVGDVSYTRSQIQPALQSDRAVAVDLGAHIEASGVDQRCAVYFSLRLRRFGSRKRRKR